MRQHIVGFGWCRRVINQRVGCFVQCFKRLADAESAAVAPLVSGAVPADLRDWYAAQEGAGEAFLGRLNVGLREKAERAGRFAPGYAARAKPRR